jgi:hypothetical protein
MVIPRQSCDRFAPQTAVRACERAPWSDGVAIEASTPMIAMTIKSSMSVKPLPDPCRATIERLARIAVSFLDV